MKASFWITLVMGTVLGLSSMSRAGDDGVVKTPSALKRHLSSTNSPDYDDHYTDTQPAVEEREPASEDAHPTDGKLPEKQIKPEVTPPVVEPGNPEVN